MINVIPENLPLGAEITGLNLRNSMTGEQIEQIRQAVHQYGVVFIRGQEISPAQQLSFAKYFGEPEQHLLHGGTNYTLPEHPEMLVVSNVIENGKQIGIMDAGSEWHTDLSYSKNPTYLSMLYSLQVPHGPDGLPLGSTAFVSTSFSYDTLPEKIKDALTGKTAVHSYAARVRARELAGTKRIPPTKEQLDRAKDVDHPIFRRHPYCNKICIFVNKAYTTEINGLKPEQSNGYLQDMYLHMTRPDFAYQHQWRVGDLVIWDNTQTQHLASFDYSADQHRRMHRVSLRGTLPI